ncbi:MAG: uracil phosphoribosyltransferase [Planctomycetaceae bacterium]
MNRDPLTIVAHPLLAVELTRLRDRATPSAEFRAALHRASRILAVEAFRSLPLAERRIETPLEAAGGHALAGRVLLAPILRAGLGMVEAFLACVPDARVAHLGIRRDEATLRPVEYYARVPLDLADSLVVLLDPMLATGGSALAAIRTLRAAGASRILLACILAAPEGVAVLRRAHPEVTILAAALDRQLDARGYIRPGLGDAGDRSCGTEL